MQEPSIQEILSLIFGVGGVTLGFIEAEYYRQMYLAEHTEKQWLLLQIQLGNITTEVKSNDRQI